MRPKVRIWVIINVGSYLVIKARNEVRNLIRNGVRVTFGATGTCHFSSCRPTRAGASREDP